MGCSAFTAPRVVRHEHWLGIIPQCFSTVFHTVHLDFAQTGKHISLTPPPNSGVKLLPGVVTHVCVCETSRLRNVSSGDASAGAGGLGQSLGLGLLLGCLGCVCVP